MGDIPEVPELTAERLQAFRNAGKDIFYIFVISIISILLSYSFGSWNQVDRYRKGYCYPFCKGL